MRGAWRREFGRPRRCRARAGRLCQHLKRRGRLARGPGERQKSTTGIDQCGRIVARGTRVSGVDGSSLASTGGGAADRSGSESPRYCVRSRRSTPETPRGDRESHANAHQRPVPRGLLSSLPARSMVPARCYLRAFSRADALRVQRDAGRAEYVFDLRVAWVVSRSGGGGVGVVGAVRERRVKMCLAGATKRATRDGDAV